MKNPNSSQPPRVRFGARMLVPCLLVALAGCVTQRIVWSPDGKQAAVLADDGLCLCDGEGNLTGPWLSGVSTVAWFKDSRRLAVGRTETCTNWQGVAAALNPQMRESIGRDATNLLAKLQTGNRKDILDAESRAGEKQRLAARLLYLRDECGNAALKLLEGASELKDLKVELGILAIAQVENGRLEVGPALAVELGGIEDIRVSPNAEAIAYTTATDGGPGRLLVIALDGGQPAQVVARTAAVYPDWSPDGNSLVYITTASTNSSGDLTLGVLTRSRVLNGRGQVEIQSAKEDLAGVMFNDQARVRCLRDGRILFASEEWRLPVTTNDLPQRQQLFALDPERQSTLTPLVPHGTQEMLPASLTYFEVSPDEKRVVIGGEKSAVAVFTLASGNVQVLQNSTDADLASLPCWRSATELCYIAIQSSNTNQHKAEVTLWQDGKPRILSQHWPEAVRKGLLD